MPEHDANPRAGGPGSPINPQALPVPDAARLLSRAGARPVTEQMIRKDIENGAPTNADGTLNLVHYAA